MINGQNFFGIHEQALDVHIRRSEIIANNLSNESTPHYLAKDLDFKEVLGQAAGSLPADPSGFGLQKTNDQHLSAPEGLSLTQKYRMPTQPSLDGNTVDGQLEHAAYAENALRYYSNITLMGHHLQRINLALSGGNR